MHCLAQYNTIQYSILQYCTDLVMACGEEDLPLRVPAHVHHRTKVTRGNKGALQPSPSSAAPKSRPPPCHVIICHVSARHISICHAQRRIWPSRGAPSSGRFRRTHGPVGRRQLAPSSRQLAPPGASWHPPGDSWAPQAPEEPQG